MVTISADRIFGISNEEQFRELAMEVFRFQAAENTVYKTYLNHLGIHPLDVGTLEEIPFLPVEFFKRHKVVTGRAFRRESPISSPQISHVPKVPSLIRSNAE